MHLFMHPFLRQTCVFLSFFCIRIVDITLESTKKALQEEVASTPSIDELGQTCACILNDVDHQYRCIRKNHNSLVCTKPNCDGELRLRDAKDHLDCHKCKIRVVNSQEWMIWERYYDVHSEKVSAFFFFSRLVLQVCMCMHF